MHQSYRTCLLLILLNWSLPAAADALMVNRPVEAASLVQHYIDEQGVQVELEIGLESPPAFKNLMPDAIYQEMGFADIAINERLRTFFERDLGIVADGTPLPGFVRAMGPSNRILRDPITGTPLPIQDDAPQVIRAELIYPFPEGQRPDELLFIAPPQSDIGFVAYHKGVAVNDYRYLASLRVEVDGQRWKLKDMSVLQEERL